MNVEAGKDREILQASHTSSQENNSDVIPETQDTELEIKKIIVCSLNFLSSLICYLLVFSYFLNLNPIKRL